VFLSVDRVARLARRHGERFLGRAFTAEERADCEGRLGPERMAARLAAKAALRKALPERHLPLRAIRIRRGAGGAPRLYVPGMAGSSLFVSLSHDGGVAAAAVFVEPGPP
jgi:holo-[acyl-carrier-protein] synthase